MKQSTHNRWFTRICLYPSTQTWGKQGFCLWGMFVLLMVSGCRNPQSSVINKGPEPNRPYTRQQSALTAEPSKPTLARPSSAQTKTNASDATTQRPTVPQIRPNLPAQTRATRTIVLGGSPTSRPTAKFETLLTWQSFVGNAKIEKVRVYGEDRPRIVSLWYREYRKTPSFLHQRILFLNKNMTVIKQDAGTFAKIDPSGNAVLIYEYSPRNSKAILLDSAGNIRWKIPWDNTEDNILQFFASDSLNTILTRQILHGGRTYVEAFDIEKNKSYPFPPKGDVGWAYQIDASPKRTEFAYSCFVFDPMKKKLVLEVRRVRMKDKETLWKTTLEEDAKEIQQEGTQIVAGNNYTGVVTCHKYKQKCTLFVLNQYGKLLWQKAGGARISFWPNETRMVVGSDLLETHTGRLIKENILYASGQTPSGQWGILAGGKLMALDGKIYDLQVGEIWGGGWYDGCSLILVGGPSGSGLYRLQPRLLNKLIPCKGESLP